jgi:tight adherence protein C
VNTSQIAILALVFVAVVATIGAISMVFAERGRMRQRLRRVGAIRSHDATPGSMDADAASPLQRIAEPVARIATPDSEEEITRYRARFLNAGIRDRAAPVYFFAIKTALALALPALTWLVLQFVGSQMKAQTLLAVLVLVAAIGFYAPNGVLARMAERRQRAIFEAFPDGIDLMVVCIEAGLTLDMAIQRSAKEMELRSEELAEELSLVGVELRIGATRERALRNLAIRTGVEEVQTFVAMLLQADRFGTSIADSMRVHAEDLRLRRQYRAEEEASKIPTKLLFPLMLTIFPALMLVLVGPAVINLMRQVMPAMRQGLGG